MRNPAFSVNATVDEAVALIAARLPRGWQLQRLRGGGPQEADLYVEISAPDERASVLAVEAKERIDPKLALMLTRRLRSYGRSILVAPYLSRATRERLTEVDANYIDLTGNARVVLSDPGLFIETHGAQTAPGREDRPIGSLRGPKAGRVVRALIDNIPPYGVRKLAELARVDAGHASRVLTFLDREALVSRDDRGRVATVDWPRLLRRWAEEVPLSSRGVLSRWIEPRGMDSLRRKLRTVHEAYALTGSLAAQDYAPVAAARLAIIYAREPGELADQLGLHAADEGANTILVEPGDEGVFAGAAARDDQLWYVAPSQTAADLLTSPGRGPAEGEALIAWMAAHEGAWRAG